MHTPPKKYCKVFNGLHREGEFQAASSQTTPKSSRRSLRPCPDVQDNPWCPYPVDPGWGETQWTFTCPRAPNTNGATEAMVGVAKRAIRKAMPKYELTDSLLHTVFTYCEDIANRRPLVRNFSDPHDPEVLTPGHFIGAARGPLPETKDHGPKNKYTVKWLQVAQIRDEFYQRFQRELIPELEKQAKWWNLRPEPKVGDIVCVLETKRTEYGHWPLGKILETYSGRDGIVRSALVKLQDAVLRRHLSHLIPLAEAREERREVEEEQGAGETQLKTNNPKASETARFEAKEQGIGRKKAGADQPGIAGGETAGFKNKTTRDTPSRENNPYAKYYPEQKQADEQGRTPRELRLLKRNK